MPSRRWRALLACSVATLACNEGLKPTAGCPGICGTVTYQGALPDSLKDSTDAVFVLTYRTFPQAPTDLFNFQPLPPATVPTGGPPHRYALAVPPATYEWVLAVWKKKSTEPLSATNADTLLREVGFYHDDGDTTSHGTGIVVVVTGTDSINFVIDFSKMNRICTYFPPCP